MLSEGKQPTLYYLCIGQMPANVVDEPVKFNLPFYILKIFSVACHAFVCIRFIVNRIDGIIKKRSKTNSASTAALLNKIHTESLFR
jgi:hypothetical protein